MVTAGWEEREDFTFMITFLMLYYISMYFCVYNKNFKVW